MKPVVLVMSSAMSLVIGCQKSPSSEITASNFLADTKTLAVVGNTSEATSSTPFCPSDMQEVEGDYCPNLQITCLYNVEISGKRQPGPGNLQWACGEYQYPTVCLSDHTVHMHFCMDRYEWPNHLGQKPQDWMTWIDAKKAVASVGKRLCTAREWTLAAEGPNLHPLPYGDGYHRDSSMCNIDRHFSDFPGVKIDVFQSRKPNDQMSENLRAYLIPSGTKSECRSDFGIYDMAGNIDEWVENVGGRTTCPKGQKCAGWISGLKGGHIWHVRQASRPMTDAHGPTFGWYETGTRACLTPR
jgi:sulfatase modifying factor 1